VRGADPEGGWGTGDCRAGPKRRKRTPRFDRHVEASPQASGGDRTLSLLAYLGPFVVVPLLMRKKGRFLFFHTRQGLYFFVLFLAAFILTFVPILLMRGTSLETTFVFVVCSVLLLLELTVYVIVSLAMMVQSARGQMPMLPLLGEMAGEG